VVTYYAKISLDERPADVKPGMTASVAVVLDKRENVVYVPTSAVPSQGSTATLTVREGSTDSQRSVAIGLRGDEGVEITSGLKAGDKVVITSAASSPATATRGGPPAGGLPGGGGIN
jgi:macrolide-specific efflux system membrane fusion protein